MKFEEMLPAVREGKKIRRKNWYKNSFLVKGMSGGFEALFRDNGQMYTEYISIFAEDWEIFEEPVEEPKQKVKYYPCLVKNKGYFDFSGNKFKNNEDGIKYYKDSYSENYEFIRIITEIPELIEERDE